MDVDSMHPKYREMFLASIVRSSQYMLKKLQEITNDIPAKDQTQALHLLSFVLKLNNAWSVGRDLLLIIAPNMEQYGHRDQWAEYLQRGIKQSQHLEDIEAEAWLRLYVGELYQFLTEYDKARREFEISVTHFERLNKGPEQARALNSFANVARHQRKFEDASQLVEKALTLSEGAKEGQAHSYLVQGMIAFDQHAWQKAYDFFEKSLALSEETTQQRMEAWGLNNLGLALWRLKKYEQSITYYEKAISIFDIIQDPVHQAAAKMNLGIVNYTVDRFTEALALYLEAEPTLRQTQAWAYLAMVNNNKGMAYQKLERYNEAEDAYSFSIDQWQQIGDISALVNVMDNLGLVYFEQDLYDKAMVTLSEALNKLAQIKNDPNYDYLFEMISKNLQAATKQKES